jgi:hypothetical protein
MSTRLIPVLLLTAMLYALGASISGLPRHPAATPAQARQALVADTSIPVLATITVRPDDELAASLPVTLLPTITVRPSADEIATARALDSRTVGTGAVVVALHALGGGMASRSGLDMPYYSFGKSVYRLRKE